MKNTAVSFCRPLFRPQWAAFDAEDTAQTDRGALTKSAGVQFFYGKLPEPIGKYHSFHSEEGHIRK